MDAAGNLYGTTLGDGSNTWGTVFQLEKNGKFNLLYTFSGGADGGSPGASLLLDSLGNLYGTTAYGGDLKCNPPDGCGTVFEVNTKHKESVLHAFDLKEGIYPSAPVIMDASGNLYSTTLAGGNSACGGGAEGCGTIFELRRDKSGWNLVVLHIFTGRRDGGRPYASGVLRDARGNLYGTASQGGKLSCAGGIGCGTIFELNSAGKLIVLYSFIGSASGASPNAGLLRNAKGIFYGTASEGGGDSYGTVWKLTP